MPTTTTSVAMRALRGGEGNFLGTDWGDRRYHEIKNNSSNYGSVETTCKQSTNVLPHKKQTKKESPVYQTDFNVGSDQSSLSVEPKAMFHYLVNYLDVTPEQASALKDSRSVAKELDSLLGNALALKEELRKSLNECGEDLEAEFAKVRSILSPKQTAKFLVWVANNGACMHMLNELWSKDYPDPMLDSGSLHKDHECFDEKKEANSS